MRLRIGLATGLALLVGAAGAEAAPRYASPDGSGSACTQQTPCALAEAVGGAAAGDEVIVGAGDYAISGGPLNVAAAGLHMHGDLAATMPRVFAKLGGQPAIILSGEGARLGYLEVQNEQTEGTGIRCVGLGALVERTRSTGIGEGAAGIVASPGCAVRDSLVRGQGTNSIGIEAISTEGATGSTFTNLTAIASGVDSAGVKSRFSAFDPGSHTLTLINSIAEGAADLRTEASPGGTGLIVASHSNFDSSRESVEGTISGSANQTAPPLFVRADLGDFREAAGSPTIDAGAPREPGALDLAGNPRSLGPAVDIGAYESAAPPPVTAAAITSLVVSPKAFKPRKRGGAIVSARATKAKRGATVRYELTGAAQVGLSIERALKGRRVGGKCKKQSRGNRAKKRCTRFVALKGTFAHQGAAGQNSFKFSGRVRGKALKPGRYRLVARTGVPFSRTGGSVKRAPFRIVE